MYTVKISYILYLNDDDLINKHELQKEEKKAKLSGETVRRPFDRDLDLQINRFDQAQKNAVIKKAQCLDDRFSRGKF